MTAYLPLVAWCAAFWVSFVAFRRRSVGPAECQRFIIGLCLGAAAAHGGWLASNVPMGGWTQAAAGLTGGFSGLFVPAGLLVAAPWRGSREALAGFLSRSLLALLLGLAVARLGCLAAGCCQGVATSAAWLSSIGLVRHPFALYDLAGLLGIHAVASRLPDRHAAAAALIGLGCLRLAIEPYRMPSGPEGGVQLTALVWVTVGTMLFSRPPSARPWSESHST